MDHIIKDGVINPTYGVGSKNSDTRPIREVISKFSVSDADTVQKGTRLFETPDLIVKNESLNFKQRKGNLDPKNAHTDLYTRGNIIYNSNRHLLKERRTAVYVNQRDEYNKVAIDYSLDSKGFHENNERFKGTFGNFDEPKIPPFRKIDSDYTGTKFLSSVSGFKNIERREMTQSIVPLTEVMNSRYTPISTINNGTKSTRLIRY